jgi:magnesium transporter
MLQMFTNAARGGPGEAAPFEWMDLLNPTPDEITTIRERFGVEVPSREQLEEIEATSRLRIDGKTLYLSTPLITGKPAERGRMTPAGFILQAELCITVRFADLTAFDAVIAEAEAAPGLGAIEVFTRLLEEVVDRAADHLEHASAIVADSSGAIFFDDQVHGLSRKTAVLRTAMRTVGRASDRSSRVRYELLSVDRLVAFVIDRCQSEHFNFSIDRVQALRHDIASLDEFEASLSDRIQLLQDAAAGFISIEQNEVVKVLTIASVVGVPPVLVVGVYGMNFKFMPELAWHFGYPFALLLCVISAALPLIWFKWRGWL